MYEITGLVFDDMQWRDPEELGEPRSKAKARMLVRGLLLSWLITDN